MRTMCKKFQVEWEKKEEYKKNAEKKVLVASLIANRFKTPGDECPQTFIDSNSSTATDRSHYFSFFRP